MSDLISRKAAVDVIMDADVCVTWNGVISDDDAVDIAIKSTKGSVISSIVNMPTAQPETHEKRTETHSCDLISRQDAIEAHYEYCNKHPDAGFPVWSLKILEDLLSADLSEYSDKLWKRAYERGRAEPQQRWIPCSERLPDEEVLCCDTRGEMIIGYPYPDEESNTGFSAESDDVFMIDCAAWMPLPKPYRKEN